MLPRSRRQTEDNPSQHPLNRSEVFNRSDIGLRDEETRIMKRSTFINKTTGLNSRLPSRGLEIATGADIAALREVTSMAARNGLNTNKAHDSGSAYSNNHLSEREQHNENVNILNQKKRETQNTAPLESEQELLSEMVTSDSKQMLVSKCLRGRLLARATTDELSQNQSEKRKVFPLLVPANSKLINYQPTKASVKPVGCISSYAANTNQGISRNYNEDRVSIILNIAKGTTKCSFFAIYDGHGGSSCCDYLRDSLHDHIINQPTFLDNTREALVSGVKAAESAFLEKVSEDYQKSKKLDRSGSCGVITLLMGDTCYVANVGDSRAVLSAQSGKYAYNLSRDHKPTDLHEQRRIQQAGGKIYKTEVRSLASSGKEEVVSGPLRVFPGKLSVTRTFGDVQAKDQRLGGNSKVVMADPQIKHFEIKPNHDFIILGSDGIFDRLDSKDAVKIVWQTVDIFKDRGMTIHQLLSVCVEEILREVMNRRSLDNITVVMIAFKNFELAVAQAQADRPAEEKRTDTQGYRSR